MKIFDCTTYFEEDLMLDVRFNILNEFVHKFIVVEAKFSHSGKPKKLNFDINKFKKFKDKIIYLVIENEPPGIIELKNDSQDAVKKRLNSLRRIEQSYDYMAKGIETASDDDLIVLSDNDEIPNFNSKQFKDNRKKIIIFKQLFFYYKFNLYYDLIPWYGSKAVKKKDLKSFSWLRNLKTKKYPFWRIDTYFDNLKQRNLEIIDNGGWHFTNVKTPKDLFNKLTNFGHHIDFEISGQSVEDLEKSIRDQVVNYNHKIDKKEINKNTANYKLKKIDLKFLPEYLVSNKSIYDEWFAK